jgi:DNA-binding NtrC family response regulator
MTAACSVALVSLEPHFGAAVKGRLEDALGCALLVCRPDAVCHHLGPEVHGWLVLAVAGPKDAASVRLLAQEVSLQRWPVRLLVVESEESARAGALDELDPYVAARLTWPAGAARAAALILDPTGCARGFPAPARHCPLGPDCPIAREPQSPLRRALAIGSQAPSLLPLAERLELAARHDITVLLTGETGTGKTYVARLLHEHSARRHHPFVHVPCGAVPAELLESTFFGHVRGAFTGADRDRCGKFAAAGEGTILLDEIDTLDPAQQASLLRVIETGEYEPVGGDRTVKSAARVIAASNWDLEEAVAVGKFRRDLYYRLNIMAFHLPPLRERVEDIAPLARSLAARFNTKFRKDLFEVSPRALDVLEAYDWPGNIRQLENVLQQAVLCSAGPVLLPEHLPAGVRQCPPPRHNDRPPAAGVSPDLLQNREHLERNLIRQALLNHGDNRLRAARSLGISRVTLYRKMKKYGFADEGE